MAEVFQPNLEEDLVLMSFVNDHWKIDIDEVEGEKLFVTFKSYMDLLDYAHVLDEEVQELIDECSLLRKEIKDLEGEVKRLKEHYEP